MKRLLALTTALCAVAAGFGTATAFADGGEGLSEYPNDFTREVSFSSLDDYAVTKGKYAFVEKGVIFELSGDNFYSYQDDSLGVKAVYYSESGALCYGNDDGIFEHGTDEPVEIEKPEDSFTLGGYFYSFNEENVLIAYNVSTTDTTPLDGFTNLKKFGDVAYAVKDNALYTINGTDTEKCELRYLDFSDTQKILTDGVTASIKTLSAEAPRFVTLEEGAYMTSVDGDALDGTYFKVGKTVKAEGQTAVLIADTGKIAMVMSNGACYILRSENTAAVERNAVAPPEFDNLVATVTVGEGYIYAAPFVCKSTQLAEIKAGDIVKVAGSVTKATNPELARDFYKVEFTTENEQTVTGYVPYGYVSPYQFVEKPPVQTPDPDYTEGDLIKPVVLIIVVIALVLIAAGYLIFVATGGKGKKDKKVK